MSVSEASREVSGQVAGKHRSLPLRVTLFEAIIVLAAVVTLAVGSIDALEGQRIGRDNDLAIAKLRGKQELMANQSFNSNAASVFRTD